MMSPSISTHILLKINLRIKILYCLLFLKTEEEEFCNYPYQTSAIFIYILTNVTEFMPEMDKYLSSVIPFSWRANFHMVIPKTHKSFRLNHLKFQMQKFGCHLPLPKGTSCQNKTFSEFRFLIYTLVLGFTWTSEVRSDGYRTCPSQAQ